MSEQHPMSYYYQNFVTIDQRFKRICDRNTTSQNQHTHLSKPLWHVSVVGSVCCRGYMKPVKHAPLNLLHSVMNLLNPSLCNRNYSTRNLRSKRFLSPQHRVLQVPGFKQRELTCCHAFLLSSKYH